MGVFEDDLDKIINDEHFSGDHFVEFENQKIYGIFGVRTDKKMIAKRLINVRVPYFTAKEEDLIEIMVGDAVLYKDQTYKVIGKIPDLQGVVKLEFEGVAAGGVKEAYAGEFD